MSCKKNISASTANWENSREKSRSESNNSFTDTEKGRKCGSAQPDDGFVDETKRKVPDYVRVLVVTDVNGRKKQLFIPAALDLERPKRPRTTFTEKQLEVLEREFQENHFIPETKRQKLASYLDLSETQIKVWFQNRRTKYRRVGNTAQDAAATRQETSSATTESTEKAKLFTSLDFSHGVNPAFPSQLHFWPYNPYHI